MASLFESVIFPMRRYSVASQTLRYSARGLWPWTNHEKHRRGLGGGVRPPGICVHYNLCTLSVPLRGQPLWLMLRCLFSLLQTDILLCSCARALLRAHRRARRKLIFVKFLIHLNADCRYFIIFAVSMILSITTNFYLWKNYIFKFQFL